MSSHGQGSTGSMRETMDRDMWQYVKDMETRMARMEDESQKKMQSLQDEVTTLRAQLAQQHAQAAVSQQEAHFESK
jgi:Skp family chaperone for outer membrane proteins